MYINGKPRQFINKQRNRGAATSHPFANTRRKLPLDDCMAILEAQEGRCALTGIPLTFTAVRGHAPLTNASFDRIDPTKPYTKDNVRFVARIVNTMRHDMDDETLRFWCKAVLDGHKHQ